MAMPVATAIALVASLPAIAAHVVAAVADESDDAGDAEDLFASLNSLILTGSLLALVFIAYRINTHRIKYLPESGAAMALGFLVGLTVRVLNLTQEEQLLDFRGEVFFYLLLPPIIFEAGLSLETQRFVDNLGAIFTFAVFGTLVSTQVVSFGLRRAAEAGLIGLAKTPSLRIHCHLFGALISATDPVATIALFGGSRFKADPLLHALVNGESVLNDAVAIVLFSTLSHHMDEEEPRLLSFPILGHFFLVSFGSLVAGLAAGAACSWFFRHSPQLRRFPDYEISAMCLSAYVTFALSQLFGLSGIVALFFFGVVLAHYNWYNLSEPAKVASKVTFGTLAKLAESCVFLNLGIMSALALGRFHWHATLVLYAVLVIVVARAAHVFPFTMILNLGRRRKKIDRNMSFMMWISGMRGAIAFALSLRIPCASGSHARRGSDECRNSDLLVTTTISIVLLTTLIVGTAIEHIAKALDVIEPQACVGYSATDHQLMSPHSASLDLSVPLASQSREEDSASVSMASAAPPEHGGGPEAFPGSELTAVRSRSLWSLRFNGRGHFYQAFARFDARVLQPALGGPCRARAATGHVGAMAVGADRDNMELPGLHGFVEQPGWPRHAPPPPTDDEAPSWSRSFVFE